MTNQACLPRIGRTLFSLTLVLLTFASGWIGLSPRPALAQFGTIPTPPAWQEPRGVNIVDMVGLVPEDHLVGATISYETGTGLHTYLTGGRDGSTVMIHTAVTPRYFSWPEANGTTLQYTKMGCLGQHGVYDQWQSTAPESRMRVFADEQEITSQIIQLMYAPAGLSEPLYGPNEYMRYPYPADQQPWISPGNEALTIPANNGCTIVLSGRHTNLTATFQLSIPQNIHITHVESKTFRTHSYVGYPGEDAEGVLANLAAQMQQRFGDRHDKFELLIPASADFILVNYAPTPMDPYAAETAENFGLAGSGTWRLENNAGGLSVDHVSAIGIPLYGQWQDSDQSSTQDYLRHFTDLRRITSPEYFLPPRYPFYECMVRGGCPDSLLQDLYDTEYEFTVHFYRFDVLPNAPLLRVPLRQVGASWNPGDLVVTDVLAHVDVGQQGPTIYLPLVGADWQGNTQPPEDRSGCPCGWFDLQGRMYDYVPQP